MTVKLLFSQNLTLGIKNSEFYANFETVEENAKKLAH